jgi:hypothetical protein
VAALLGSKYNNRVVALSSWCFSLERRARRQNIEQANNAATLVESVAAGTTEPATAAVANHMEVRVRDNKTRAIMIGNKLSLWATSYQCKVLRKWLPQPTT